MSGWPVYSPSKSKNVPIYDTILQIMSNFIRPAALGATVLMGIAVFAVWAIPHGFEEGMGWFKFLLPGVWVAGPLTEAITIANPSLRNFIFRVLLFAVSFVWYFGICFVVLKAYRFARRF